MDSIWPVVIASILFISLVLVRILRNAILSTQSERVSSQSCHEKQANQPAEIIPLPEFDWRKKKPLQFRPFKPKYHMTMAVEKSSVSELIEMDWNYLNRVSWRQKIIQDHPETVVGAEDICEPAINEFYTWLLGNYLPTRFPRMFRLSTAQKGVTTILRSIVTGEEFCLDPPEKPVDALKIVGRLVDDDFQFLVRSEDGDGYVLKGIVTCCPSGFDMSKKMNLKLRDIHKAIPGYKEKLEKSMDRFFDRLEVGTFVKRVNWTITTSNELFTPSGTHLYEGEEMPEVEIDINQVHLRCERQVVHRLPKSGAIIFSFKTYLYPVTDIKTEGLGEDLATAIEGLQLGSVPAFHWYKRAAVWGDAVKSYLRS